jgi:hypothetical protein
METNLGTEKMWGPWLIAGEYSSESALSYMSEEVWVLDVLGFEVLISTVGRRDIRPPRMLRKSGA